MRDLVLYIQKVVKVVDDLKIKDVEGEWTSRYLSELTGDSYKSYEDVEYYEVCVFGSKDQDDITITLDDYLYGENQDEIDITTRVNQCVWGDLSPRVKLKDLNRTLRNICKKLEWYYDSE